MKTKGKGEQVYFTKFQFRGKKINPLIHINSLTGRCRFKTDYKNQFF